MMEARVFIFCAVVLVLWGFSCLGRIASALEGIRRALEKKGDRA